MSERARKLHDRLADEQCAEPHDYYGMPCPVCLLLDEAFEELARWVASDGKVIR